MDFGRVITAMVTPFTVDGKVNLEEAQKLARYLVETGSDGIVVAGTTGESPNLKPEEKLDLFRAVKEAVGQNAAVIAGTGSYSTESSVELSKKAETCGIDGIMVVVPYYNKPCQRGLYEHFKMIAQSTNLPVMLYNVPSRTGRNMTAETVCRLAEIDNIVAVKEASGDLDQVSEIIRNTDSSFRVYSGDDSLTLPMLSLGAYGVVSVASHLVGEKIKQMIEAFVDGKVQEASRLHLELFPLFKALFVTTNPVPVKVAMRLAGFQVGSLKLPLVEPNPQELNVIREALESFGLIK
ncbi:4-hydroxy-tetrahydrodipicolinate synthase [Calderihabitans maritimus]|uniref:4-hydroxy-tetrahydrodipicolinate synthase n=1 Tax=Calderihabitans maritimus TaxID=1246530 RepID=A0A1Z5HQR3_9FIRM|nr:4-hydroxy-tetrahydrodipicolinate synthase [Calderihabitans maritimus]GAW91778.1 dihydrodipicolinate synthase [Calderihabitans maritimus]